MARSILIVADEDRAMTPFHELLDAHGYGTLRTNKTDEAFALANRHHPDLILIELRAPDGSRHDLVRRIKSDHGLHDTPLVAITDQSGLAETEQMRSDLYDALLVKPISVTRFVETLNTFLH